MKYEQVVSEFQYSGSIKQTAEALGISINTVRRVLITEGLWRSKSSVAIGDLYRQGLTVKEIANQLHMTEGNVQAYLPYSKGMYMVGERSNDAVRCDRYRSRRIYDQQIQEQKYDIQTSNNAGNIPIVKKRTAGKISNGKVAKADVVHLRLSLVMDLTDSEMQILRKYGKMNDGITRDVLVPSTMTLHAMHYLIQRAFGWKNEHFRYFALPTEIFDSLTQNSFEQWTKLCGVYFRFTDMEAAENFWDDDYNGKTSFRSWLRTKYCGPYDRFPASELYAEIQERISAFYAANPTIRIWDLDRSKVSKACNPREATLDEVLFSGCLGSGANELLERLTISDLFIRPETNQSNIYMEGMLDAVPITRELVYHYHFAGPDWQVRISIVQDSENGSSVRDSDIGANETPICTAQDGLELLESSIGIAGFCDFLMGLNSPNFKKRKRYQDEAEQIGWTNRRRALHDVV